MRSERPEAAPRGPGEQPLVARRPIQCRGRGPRIRAPRSPGPGADPCHLPSPQLALEQRCRELSARGRRLEETLPGRIGSEEQREVLSLLCRVHELEVDNTAMQSHALLREGALRHRREALRRLEQHRALCDEIIQGQRQVIDGASRPSSPPPAPSKGEGSKDTPEPCFPPLPFLRSRLQPGGPPAPGGALRGVPAGAGGGRPGAGHHHGPRGLPGPAGGRLCMLWGRGQCPRQGRGTRLADTPGSRLPFPSYPAQSLATGMPHSHSLPQNSVLGGSQPALQPWSSWVPLCCYLIQGCVF